GGSCTPRLNRTPTSRATPICDRQSGRLLVTSRSMAMSPSTSETSSRLSPAIINRSVSASTGMSSRTYSFSQFQLTIIGSSSFRRSVRYFGCPGTLHRLPGAIHDQLRRIDSSALKAAEKKFPRGAWEQSHQYETKARLSLPPALPYLRCSARLRVSPRAG